jgi:signal transduction histidine kinase
MADIKQNEEILLAANKWGSLGVMSAGIGHCFGNLVGSILFETEVALLEMPSESPAREEVAKIAAVARRAGRLIKILLNFARSDIESPTTEPVDLSLLVEQTLQLLSEPFLKRAVVRTNLPMDLPPVRGNVQQIQQVVINLVMNAAEALYDVGGVITVSTERAHHEASGFTAAANDLTELSTGEYVRLRVADTGCGMNAETRARVFDQFFTTKSLGRGLGLTVVDCIVRSHGGAIDLESAPDAGTTFSVLLPVYTVTGSSGAEEATHRVEDSGAQIDCLGRKAKGAALS